MRTHRVDYLTAYRFHLLDLTMLGVRTFCTNYPRDFPGWSGFKSISLPEVTLDTETYRDGNNERGVKYVTGVNFSDVTLAKGVTWYDSDFYFWIMEAAMGRVAEAITTVRRDLLVMALAPLRAEGKNIGAGCLFWHETLDGEREQIAIAKAWLLKRCLPIKYSLGKLDATSNEVLISELTVSPELVAEVMFPLETQAYLMDLPSVALSVVRATQMSSMAQD